jgi:hypothetical protein
MSEIEKHCEDGLHRRYKLLFALTGGALVLAAFIFQEEHLSPKRLGELTLRDLSGAMATLTAVIVTEMYAFGIRMRRRDKGLFGGFNRFALTSFGGVIIAGWIHIGWDTYEGFGTDCGRRLGVVDFGGSGPRDLRLDISAIVTPIQCGWVVYSLVWASVGQASIHEISTRESSASRVFEPMN